MTKASARVILPAEPKPEMVNRVASLKLQRLRDLGERNKGLDHGIREEYAAMTKDAPTLDSHTLAVIEFMKERCADMAKVKADGYSRNHCEHCRDGEIATHNLAVELRTLSPAALLAEIRERGL